MKKKLIASITCLSLLLVMLLSSTLAWFTDTDMSHNTMTVGNVSIKQHEVFDESKPLFPAVIADGFVKDADGFWNSDLINNEVNKVVTVENTGSYPAYVRTVFAFEMMWNGTTWEDPIGDEIILNDYRSIVFDPATPPVIIYRYITNGAGNKAQYYYSAENLGSADAAFVVGIATYFDDPKAALPAGQTTDPSLLQFYLAEDVGNEFYDAVKQRYEILALSQAMQHAGFEDMGIDKAMEKAFGPYNAENAAKWFGTGEFIIPGGNEDVAVNGSPVDSTDTEYVLRGFDVDMFNQGTSEKVASICVPTRALKNGDPRNFRVTMTKTEYEGNFTVANNMETASYNFDVKGLLEGNTDELKVKLYMGEGMDDATFKMYHYDTEIPCTYDPSTGYVTFRTATFSPFTVVYDKDSVHVPTVPVVPQPGENPSDLPKANVVKSAEYENVDLDWGAYGQWSPTEGLDSQLEAAYTFSCVDTLDQAKANPYANWYCDFYVKLDRDLGANQIFLGGHYGSFEWIGFHNGDLTLEANTEIPLLGSVTSNPWTYVDVVQNVGTFICGVGDVDDALAGATFTVMLRLTNPEDETEFYNVATINYTFVKKTTVTNSEELKDALAKESDGAVIYLSAGTYDGLDFINPASYKAKNVTIIGGEGAIINGMFFAGEPGDGKWKCNTDGLSIKNVTFTGNIQLNSVEHKNILIQNCMFKNNASIIQDAQTGETVSNLTVKNCSFTGNETGNVTAISLSTVTNLTVEGCEFNNIQYNVLQVGKMYGTVLIDNNKINGTGSRVFRFVTVDADMTISNNTIVSNGGENGELAKATNACEITLTGNTWNGKTDAEVANKLINITAK